MRRAVEAGVTFFDTADMYGAAPARRSPAGCCACSRVARTTCSRPRSTTRCGRRPERRGCRARTSWTPSTPRCAGSGVDHVDLYQMHRWDAAPRSRRRWRPCTTSSGPGRPATSGRPACGPGSSRSRSTGGGGGWTASCHAEPLQPRVSRGGARDAAVLPRPGGRRAPLQPARPRPPRRHQAARRPRRPRRAASLRPSHRLALEGPRRRHRGPRGSPESAAPPAAVALAWLLARPGVTAPVVGATRPHHLTDAVEAVELRLDDEEVQRLEAPYRSHAVVGPE